MGLAGLISTTVLSLEFQGHQAKGEWIYWSKGRVAPSLGSFRGGGSLVEAPALGLVFSPVAHFLYPLEPGSGESTGATLFMSCPIFMKASIPPLVLGASYPLLCLQLPMRHPWWTPQRKNTVWGPVLLRRC